MSRITRTKYINLLSNIVMVIVGIIVLVAVVNLLDLV